MISNDMSIIIHLIPVFVTMTMCDLFICHYFLNVKIRWKFFIRVLIANIIGLAVVVGLEYSIKITPKEMLSDFIAKRLDHFLSLLTLFILTGSKLAVYGKLLPVSFGRSFGDLMLSTFVGLLLGIIVGLLFKPFFL